MTDARTEAAVAASGRPGDEAAWLAPELARGLRGCNPDAIGVYVATADAGGARSTAFWARALRETVGLVSPHDFPLTLASSIATDLARTLGLRGPNQTLVGGPEASAAAMDEAAGDLAAGLIERAVVMRYNAEAGPDGSAAAHAILLAIGDNRPPDEANGDPIVGAARRFLRDHDMEPAGSAPAEERTDA